DRLDEAVPRAVWTSGGRTAARIRAATRSRQPRAPRRLRATRPQGGAVRAAVVRALPLRGHAGPPEAWRPPRRPSRGAASRRRTGPPWRRRARTTWRRAWSRLLPAVADAGDACHASADAASEGDHADDGVHRGVGHELRRPADVLHRLLHFLEGG